MKITKLSFIPTGAHDDQFYRPYMAMADAKGTELMKSADPYDMFTPESLAAIAQRVIKPCVAERGIAPIVNGWGAERLRFVMVVKDTNSFGVEMHHYLSGYTDHGDVAAGTLDPNMRLYFNRSIEARRVQRTLATVDASHILTHASTPYRIGEPFAVTMRPTDVLEAVGRPPLPMDVIDVRPSFTTCAIKKSSIGNGLATYYLGQLLDSVNSAMIGVEINDTVSDVFRHAAIAVRERTVSGDRFLNRVVQDSDLGSKGYVTYGELCALQDDLGDVVTVVARPHSHLRGVFSQWNTCSTETYIATVLRNAVPALLCDASLSGVRFQATNRTRDGHVELMVDGAVSMYGMNQMALLPRFKQRLKTEVLENLVGKDDPPFDLTVDIDIFSDATIVITLGDHQFNTFRVPMFADGLTAPVMTPDNQTLTRFSEDVCTLLQSRLVFDM